MCQERPELDNDGVVFRLGMQGLTTDVYFHAKPRPPLADFRLGDRECAAAEANEGIGGLSVWDYALTSPNEARAFLEGPRPSVYRLKVADIRALTTLHVCRQPSTIALPGAAGHCLIANAYSRDEKTRRAIRSSIVRVAEQDLDNSIIEP